VLNDGWKIYRGADGAWRWKYVMHGRTVAQARLGHEQYSSCIAEARVHGYREHVTTSARTRSASPAHQLRAKGKKR
jgi:hypothetical protein